MADEQQHDLAQWPEILRRLAAILGPELTLRLAAEHGGRTKTRIPVNARRAHPWRSIIEDDEMWARLVADFRAPGEPEFVYLPRGAFVRKLKKQEILELSAAGHSVSEILRRLNVDERYVRRVLGSVRTPEQALAAKRHEIVTTQKRRRRRRGKTAASVAEAKRRRTAKAAARQLTLF